MNENDKPQMEAPPKITGWADYEKTKAENKLLNERVETLVGWLVELRKERSQWRDLAHSRQVTIEDLSKQDGVPREVELQNWKRRDALLQEQNDRFAKTIAELRQQHQALQAVLGEREATIAQLDARLTMVSEQCDVFKDGCNEQEKAWRTIREFIPDVNGLSLVDMVRQHVEDLKGKVKLQKESIDRLKSEVAKFQSETALQYAECKRQTDRADGNFAELKKAKAEIEDLKANNRYQRGYTDGHAQAIARVKQAIDKILA